MQDRSPKVGISPSTAHDAIGLIGSHLHLRDLLFGQSRSGSGRDVTYDSCADLWRDIMRDQLRVTTTIQLRDFCLSEWFPLRPGLYHARPSAARRYGASAEIISGPGSSPERLEQFLALSGLSISAEAARRLLGSRRAAVYNPYGKTMMLDGGVGCVRLGSKQLPDGHVWFMGAASEPVAHQGIPVALPDALYRRHIGQVATNGAVRCTITGELRYLPDDLNHPYRALRGIPQVYIIAKEVRQPNPLRAQEFIADGAVLIQTGQAGTPPDNPFSPTPGIFAAYVTFRPGRPDAVNEAAQWLADDYVGELLNGRVITDFDEQVRRFGDAIFSLEHIMSGRVPIADAERLIGDLAKPREAAELVQLIMNGNVHVTTIIGSHNAVASESSAAAAGSAAANYFHGTTNSIVQSRGQQERRMPDVILIEIAAALAAKTAESLYEFVRNKFRARKKALDVLDAASGAAPDSPQVIALAEELATAEDYDQQFGEQLRAQWAAIQGQAYDGGVVNTISGTVRGDAVQARDIHGGITFGSAQTAPPSPDPKSLRKRLSTAGDANGSPWIRQDVPADGVHDLVYSALLAAPRATGLLAPLRRPSSCRMYTATSSFNRSKILTDIHDSQCTGDRQVAVQIFHGMDDIGKTELALECAYKYEADYDVAWWVKAGGASELAPGLCLARPEAGLLRANRRTRCRRAHERPCAPVAGGC